MGDRDLISTVDERTDFGLFPDLRMAAWGAAVVLHGRWPGGRVAGYCLAGQSGSELATHFIGGGLHHCLKVIRAGSGDRPCHRRSRAVASGREPQVVVACSNPARPASIHLPIIALSISLRDHVASATIVNDRRDLSDRIVVASDGQVAVATHVAAWQLPTLRLLVFVEAGGVAKGVGHQEVLGVYATVDACARVVSTFSGLLETERETPAVTQPADIAHHDVVGPALAADVVVTKPVANAQARI